MGRRVLVINTGSSSTKVALYEDEKEIWRETVRHDYELLRHFKTIEEHLNFRRGVIDEILKRHGVERIDAVAAIGGLLKPLKSGTYLIDEGMVKDLYEGKRGFHASNLAGIIGYELAKRWNVPAFTTDPVSVDEMDTLARYSGHPLLPRYSLSHALNTKAVARKWARERGKRYEESFLVVIHLGSGITVSAHRNGRMIDLTNSMEEGPFSVERTGTLPVMSLVKLCFSGRYSYDEVRRMIFGEGGLYAYLGSKDFRGIMERVRNGDTKAKEAVDAMLYQIVKEAGGMVAILQGKVDAIIITGGMAYESYVVNRLRESLGTFAEVVVYPGEDELKALLEGALRVLRGEEKVLSYPDETSRENGNAQIGDGP
ncbi:MAG: butyrate kinase [Thermotogae bacterium]|nr:butyrate kinase [Thermotogota bacterium]